MNEHARETHLVQSLLDGKAKNTIQPSKKEVLSKQLKSLPAQFLQEKNIHKSALRFTGNALKC